ncbi:MAG: hypothetical protein AB1726_01540 [Planctomycetota bacterium]
MRVSGEVGGVDTDVDIAAASAIDVVALGESSGRATMDIDVDGVLVEGVRLSSGTELLSTGETLLDNTVEGNEGLSLAKAAWNYFLPHNDSSYRIHNPEFFDQVFVNTAHTIDTTW